MQIYVSKLLAEFTEILLNRMLLSMEVHVNQDSISLLPFPLCVSTSLPVMPFTLYGLFMMQWVRGEGKTGLIHLHHAV